MKTCFLANPTYDGMNASSVTTSIVNATRSLGVMRGDYAGSVLIDNFNKLFAEAVTNECDYFAMTHADIDTEDLWLDKLVGILEQQGADIVSCCIALKNDKLRSVSTGYSFDGGAAHLTFDDLAKLPRTFGLADVQRLYPYANGLLVNTGLWVARLRVPDPDAFAGVHGDGSIACATKESPWIRKWSGFTMQSRIDWTQDPPRVLTSSEDYIMSHQLQRLEQPPKILATTALNVKHLGRKWFEVELPEHAAYRG